MAVRRIIWSNILLLRSLKSQQLICSRKYDVHYAIKRASQLNLNRLLENNEELNGKKWSNVRDEILTTITNSNELNVDNIIINRCCEVNKQFLALNYINYLIDERKQNLNIAVIIKYFKLLYSYKETLDSEDLQRIFQYYDDIKKKYDVFDFSTAEGCILILSLTNRWKECIDLIEQNKNHCDFSNLVYTSIITAAFNNDEPEIAWSYLEQTSELKSYKKVYLAYINFCKRHFHHVDKFKEATDKIFDFWIKHGIYPHITIVTPFMQLLSNTRNWNYTPTTVNKKGICQNCNHHMPHFKMSEEDHEMLLKYILNIAIVGKDVFQKTTPTELNTFLKFIDQTKPYDVVIDGLNAAYSFNRKTKVPTERAKELRKIVTVLNEQNKKILILGKRHMLKWSKKEMNVINQNSYLFLTNNTSEDDLFTIYAALSSGRDTYFMSRDFLRDHKFILTDSRIKQIFRYWQKTHQIIPYYKNMGFAQKLEMNYPPSHVMTLHKDEGGWHIPYFEGLETAVNNQPERWMCLRINKPIENKKNS